MLALLRKDEACACVRSAEDGNGYQAWQALLRARRARNATNILKQLTGTFPSPDPRINLPQWNKNAEEYATRTGERVSDGIRRAVYLNRSAPQEMRQHLMLNQSRLSTAEEVALDIEDYWDATEEFSLDDEGQAGCHIKERVARRAWENAHGTRIPSRDVLEDTAIDVGELDTKKRSVGRMDKFS